MDFVFSPDPAKSSSTRRHPRQSVGLQTYPDVTMTATTSLHSLHLADSPFGAHRAPVTEAAPTFAHGSLRASHAVCLRYSTLEPAFCARKEGADIESVSTTGSILAESLVMQRDLSDNQAVSFGFHATSRHCISRLSPRNSNSAKRLTMALQRTAPRVTVAAILIRESLVRATFFVARMPFLRATLAATAPASAVSELGVVRRGRHPQD